MSGCWPRSTTRWQGECSGTSRRPSPMLRSRAAPSLCARPTSAQRAAHGCSAAVGVTRRELFSAPFVVSGLWPRTRRGAHRVARRRQALLGRGGWHRSGGRRPLNSRRRRLTRPGVEQRACDAWPARIESRRPLGEQVPFHPLNTGPGEARHSGEVGTTDECGREVGLHQAARPEPRSGQVGAMERRPRQIGVVEFGVGQVSTSQIACSQISPAKISASKICSGQCR